MNNTNFNILILDLETTQNSDRKFKADPLCESNSIVMYGAKWVGELSECTKHLLTHREYVLDRKLDLVVGQNLKFDLHCYMTARTRVHVHQRTLFNSKAIWDTQLAEFILTAQQSKTVSLDELAAKYGGTLKDSRVSDMFAVGMGADKVPEPMLAEYLDADLCNTELVFSKQLEQAEKEGQLPLIMSQMGALQATIEMSFNGLLIDVPWLTKQIAALETHQVSQLNFLDMLLTTYILNDSIREQFNWASNKHLTSLIFTGEFEYEEVETIGVYKTGVKKGLEKTRKVKKIKKFEPIYMGKVPEEWVTEKGSLKVDDETIEAIATSTGDLLLKELQEYKLVSKQLSTYYKGIENALYPDGYVHPSYNHCIASTGRLTSSNPNLQNITSGEIKKAFISRFPDGRLVEFDYSQLEIMGLAAITGDVQLIADIKCGRDIHTELFKDMNGRLPTKEERKEFKPLSFGLIYGASANTLAKNAGVTPVFAKAFIKTFYTRYPGVKQWHNNFPKEVLKNRKPSTYTDEDGMPVGVSVWQSPTGRKYEFREYKAPEWVKASKGISHNFSPTEMKNYPVQGLSTADIVPHMLGILYKELMKNEKLKDKCLLINTVHDSIMVDVHPDVLDESIELIKNLLEATPAYFASTFGYELPFDKMGVGVSVGPNWFDMEEVE